MGFMLEIFEDLSNQAEIREIPESQKSGTDLKASQKSLSLSAELIEQSALDPNQDTSYE